MHGLLLVLLLGAPPLVWQFPGPRGAELRVALIAARGDAPEHRMNDDELRALLEAAPAPDGLGCLADARPCADPRVEMLQLLGAAGVIVATSEAIDGGFAVTLTRSPPTEGPWTGTGATLEAAAEDAFGQLRGHGTLQLTTAPPEAAVFIDDRRVGDGSGAYPVGPGSHRLRVEAPGSRPVEQTFEIVLGKPTTLKVTLPDAYGELALLIAPDDARVLLDGAPVADTSKPIELPPGAHRLRVEAVGHDPYDDEITIKSRVRLDLTIGLQRSEEAWKTALRTPDPDTLAHPYYVRASVRLGSVLSGDVDTQTGRGDARLDLESQDAALGTGGLDVGVGWRSRYLTVEALSLGFDSGGGAVDATVDGAAGRARDPFRLHLRPGWVGGRYPAWRLEPYVHGGLVFTRETLDARSATGAYTELTHWMVLLGLELGVRYSLTPEFFVHVGGQFDFLPGERATAVLLLGGGYALELPSWL